MRQRHALIQRLTLGVLIFAIAGAVIVLDGRANAVHSQEPATPPAAAPAKAAAVGSEMCQACHDAEITAQLRTNFHGLALAKLEAVGKGHLCEGCHGPGSLHAENPSAESAAPLKLAAATGDGCLSCHQAKISAAKWRMSEHRTHGVGCRQCHMTPELTAPTRAKTPGAAPMAQQKARPQPHATLQRAPSAETCLSCHRTLRGEFSLPSHHPLREGVVSCADCHDPHAPRDDKLTRDTCAKCHARQARPHLYAHAEVKGLSDGCLDCHRPHGSPHRALLKLTGRGLCLQCHGNKAAHFPGRVCQSCHRAVHGSNTNALLLTE
ncbi:MAG TPA: cytochrome c3 family protein [Armatimonadota bacterium]|nr:cytochrome c3 family protein [Armatimonadota bacterium]